MSSPIVLWRVSRSGYGFRFNLPVGNSGAFRRVHFLEGDMKFNEFQINTWRKIWDAKTIPELYDLKAQCEAQTERLDGRTGITQARKRLEALTTYTLGRENAEAKLQAEMALLFGKVA